MPARWQLRFDDGHQQRYLPDRESVLRYVLAIGPRAASKRFEVFAESGPVRLADGTEAGRAFQLVEVIELSRPGEMERLQAKIRGGMETGNGREGPPSPSPRKIIPLMPGVARPRGERRAAMQQAVVEVIRHLVLEAVPSEHRSPLFGQARDLLSEAGWGLDELFEAREDGPARQSLFRALGLET